ncbi:Hypothetical predicted protein [Marmota monax]|uniref:Transmembrane 4 L6 family member 4 n=1 Tax=Marmota monax TaxID=9995 RepID=A0A5E4B7S9_MARMO|nr:Hypothetical predicted protein [Marmota monax]
MIFPALVFLGLKNNDCCGCCGNTGCGKRFAMFTSTIFAVIGFLGAGYSFVISAISINKGPNCLMSNNTWGYPFHDGDYLSDQALWSKCLQPDNVVSWNLTLFSILLVIGGIQMILCAIQAINGLLGTLCGDCQCCGGGTQPDTSTIRMRDGQCGVHREVQAPLPAVGRRGGRDSELTCPDAQWPQLSALSPVGLETKDPIHM